MPARRVALLGGRAIAPSNADGDEPAARKLSFFNSSVRLRRSMPMKSRRCCAGSGLGHSPKSSGASLLRRYREVQYADTERSVRQMGTSSAGRLMKF